MLDEHGFVAETNGTTMSMVKDELLLTATTKHIIVGITRGLVMRIAESNGIRTIEKDLSLYDFYNADEVFICGTVGEIVPVKEMDGRSIGAEVPGKLTRMLMAKYDEITAKEGTPIDKM
ncbi:MAG: aminotransferase class IV [Deltaproteobacteria bacterium]|nr:aminotransferase class IV [Deltaproteobacteria bacterium]MBW2152121.1 aminotransferase class IV [Deltaproteobacteria bacterium]